MSHRPAGSLLKRKVWRTEQDAETPKTQVVVLPSDYAEKGNQSTSSFRQEDHGWQGGGGWGGGQERQREEREKEP